MIDAEHLKVLKNISFFAEYGEEELTYLLEHIDKESHPQGGIIIKTGSQGSKVYFLVAGKVKVRKILSMNLDYLGYKPIEIVEDLGTFEGDYHFGEMALLGNSERSADVIADEACELYSLSKDSFDRILSEKPAIGQKMLLEFCSTLASWIRTYDGKLKENVQNRTLIEMLKTEKKKIAAMHKITRSTVFSTVGQVLGTMLEACMDCLNVEKGSLMIFKDGYLRVDAAFGLDSFDISGKSQDIKESSVSGRCFASGQALLVEDIHKTDGLNSSGDEKKYYNNSLLSVPLISLKGDAIGVLNVNNKTSRKAFNDEDRIMLQDLAQEAAAMLGYELKRLQKTTQATVPGNKLLSSGNKALPEDMNSLVEFNGASSDYTIIYEDTVRSTNDVAGEYVKKGYSHGTVVVANAQSHGKGRSGKVWASPPGLNIYMTLVVTPDMESVAGRIPVINLAASLSVVKAIREKTGLDVWPKWPNDIYFSDKMVGGILSESLIAGNTLSGLMIGIGINVNQESFPEDMKDISTSIGLESGTKHDRGDLIVEVLNNFTHYYSLFTKDSKAVIREWTELCKTMNLSVKAVTEKGDIYGTAIGLSDHGMLMLELSDKKVITLSSAEIFHLPAD